MDKGREGDERAEATGSQVKVEPAKPSDSGRGAGFWDKVATGLVIAALVGFVLFLARGGRGGS